MNHLHEAINRIIHHTSVKEVVRFLLSESDASFETLLAEGKETWYHGTLKSKEILKDGFDMDAKRVSDTGDFGWGAYFTTNVSRARVHGTVLKVIVDTSRFAYLATPYFLKGANLVAPKTKDEKLFYGIAFDSKGQMLTVSSGKSKRISVSKEIRKAFLAAGYQGIKTPYGGGELVVFDVDAIKSVVDAK